MGGAGRPAHFLFSGAAPRQMIRFVEMAAPLWGLE